ncbi:MAG: glycoside hydrolase family 3 protein [Longimicrobiales bacterium]|nr:glycoside hydrolase family 3 protein [Longimicrobiales bacterium]
MDETRVDEARVDEARVDEARITAIVQGMTLAQKLGQMTQPERQHVTPEEVAAHHIGSVLSGGGSAPGDNRPADWVAMSDAYWAASTGCGGGGEGGGGGGSGGEGGGEGGRGPGIPILYGVDAIHGHNNVRGAVIFPHNIGLGAANDPDLVRRVAQVTAREVLATGVEWTFAPTLAVARDAHWGRTYESFSEDPEIVSRLAAPAVEGLQGDLGPDAVVACAKHWVGDGGTEGGTDQGETTLPEGEFRRLHVAPYLEALRAGVLTVMASYNSWNGDKCHGHRYLLTEVLKGELGFTGLVVSDWDGIDQLDDDYGEAAARAVNAGVDLFMVPQKWKRFLEVLRAQVEGGRVPMDRIDDAVRRILRVKMAYGLFERPRPAERPWSCHPSFGSEAHREVAREAVRKSLVLLRNRGEVLPLRREARILVAGKNAHNVGHQCGGFSVEWQGVRGNDRVEGGSSVWDGIRAAAPGAVLSEDGAAAGTDDFDVAVVVIGERPYAEGMGDLREWTVPPGGSGDVSALAVPGPGRLEPYGLTLEHARNHPEDLAVLRRIAERGIPVVTVLISGRPLVVNAELARSDAFVAAWLPGSEGCAVADVLFGDHDFTGRLSFSWPHADRDNPNRGEPGAEALFPWGFGLSYRAAGQG